MPRSKNGSSFSGRGGPRAIRGGSGSVLFQTAAALVLVAAGALLWRLYMKPFAPLPSRHVKAQDLTSKAAWTQGQCRDMLHRAGLRESGVLESYNSVRLSGKKRWVEGVIRVKAPPDFKPDAFAKELKGVLSAQGVSILKSEQAPSGWVLEVGAGQEVYQRMIFS